MTTPVELALQTRLMTQRRFRLPARIRTGQLPLQFEREYRSRLLFFPNTASQLINELLVPRLPEIEAEAGLTVDAMRLDQTFDELVNRILIVARGSFENLTGRERVMSPEELSATVSADQKSSVIRQFKQLLGVDLAFDDSNIDSIVQPFITENVGLIKTIGDRLFDDIESLTLRNFRAGQRADVIAAEIIKRTKVAESRAKLIARDQINKLWGDLNRHRQTQAGVQTYKWRTAKDERVRKLHADREGKTFSWNEPPSDGHPGQPIQCRCWAEPNLDDVLNDLEAQADKALAAQRLAVTTT